VAQNVYFGSRTICVLVPQRHTSFMINNGDDGSDLFAFSFTRDFAYAHDELISVVAEVVGKTHARRVLFTSRLNSTATGKG